MQMKCRSSADKLLLSPGAAPSARLAFNIGGQYACIPADIDCTPNTLSAASIRERASFGALMVLNGFKRANLYFLPTNYQIFKQANIGGT